MFDGLKWEGLVETQEAVDHIRTEGGGVMGLASGDFWTNEVFKISPEWRKLKRSYLLRLNGVFPLGIPKQIPRRDSKWRVTWEISLCKIKGLFF